MKTENETPKQDIIEFLCGAGTYDGYWWGDKPQDKRSPFWWRTNLREYVTGLQSRVSELERENVQQKEWLEAYKKSNAEFMKSTTDQNFEIKRLEKEVETLRKALSLIRDMDDDIETEHGDPGDIAIRALAEHLDKNSSGE